MNNEAATRCCPLTDEHDVTPFDCGEGHLSAWLKNSARIQARSGGSQTYVWTADGSSTVTGYFTIAPTIVQPVGLSAKLTAGYEQVPGYLLAKLALDSTLRGHVPKLGRFLLIEALTVIIRAADTAGGRLVVVDTTNERTRRFYEGADFNRIGSSDRLIMRMSTARKALTT